jgi:hypothetical protein
MDLLVFCMSSFGKYLFKFVTHLNFLMSFSSLWCSLYIILDDNLLYILLMFFLILQIFILTADSFVG